MKVTIHKPLYLGTYIFKKSNSSDIIIHDVYIYIM